MTILENLQNSREFLLGISGTVDSWEFPNGNSPWRNSRTGLPGGPGRRMSPALSA